MIDYQLYWSKIEIMWGDAHDIHRDTKRVNQPKSCCGYFNLTELKKLYLFHIK